MLGGRGGGGGRTDSLQRRLVPLSHSLSVSMSWCPDVDIEIAVIADHSKT